MHGAAPEGLPTVCDRVRHAVAGPLSRRVCPPSSIAPSCAGGTGCGDSGRSCRSCQARSRSRSARATRRCCRLERTGAPARPGRPLGQGRGRQPDRLVQGARAERRGDARGGGRRGAVRAADRGQRRRGGRGLWRQGRTCRSACTRRARRRGPSSPRSRALGADLVLLDGHIGDCGRASRAYAAETGAFDLSTLREPYRIEGKKTLGLELAMQLGWTLPASDHLPHRRRHGADRHVEGVSGAP